MNNFVYIPDNFTLDQNYWMYNPQHQYISPFKELYKKYTKKKSSRIMWACVFLEHPDIESNKLYRLPLDEREQAVKDMLSKTIDFNDELFVECRKSWINKSLTPVQRMLKLKEAYIISREELIERGRKEMLDLPLEEGLKILESLDKAAAKNKKIYDEYYELSQQFQEEKEKQSVVYGGRQETFAERGLL